ncbi:MAG: disulfide bond formation protein B [Proteobacteria bacterium]|nr:disulfide bond formation protein B [Pseudomonadota bacterium]
MPISRLFYIALFIFCLSSLGYALYTEHFLGLEPCPLCSFQRIAYFVIMVIALIGAIHNPQNLMRTVYNILLIIIALIGAGIAGRHTWLQHLPPELVPECGPGLEYMLEVFPFAEALKMVLSGSGECAEVQWSFIGLSMPEWSLVCFSFIIIGALLSIFVFKDKKLGA